MSFKFMQPIRLCELKKKKRKTVQYMDKINKNNSFITYILCNGTKYIKRLI